MKKIVLSLLLLILFQNKIFAQGCDYYFTFNATAELTDFNGSCNFTAELGSVYVMNNNGSTNYHSGTIPNSLDVYVGVEFYGCLGGSNYEIVTINTSGCVAGNTYTFTKDLSFYAVSGQDDGDASVTLTCTWSCRPVQRRRTTNK